MKVDNVINELILISGRASGVNRLRESELPSLAPKPPLPKFIPLPNPAPRYPAKPKPKKPAAVFKQGSTVELCPSCGSEARGIGTKGGYCASCGARYKKPLKVDIQTKDPLPAGAFGKATTVMPTGTAIRIKKKKYGMPTKESVGVELLNAQIESMMDPVDGAIEEALDRMVEGVM